MTTKTAGASAEKRAKAAKKKSGAAISDKTPRERSLAAIAPFKFKPGQSGNPSGRPKRDVAAEIAQAVIEGNIEAAVKAFAKKLRKGDVKVFSALAERGYGKAPQPIEQSGEIVHRLILENIDVAAQESA